MSDKGNRKQSDFPNLRDGAFLGMIADEDNCPRTR